MKVDHNRSAIRYLKSQRNEHHLVGFDKHVNNDENEKAYWGAHGGRHKENLAEIIKIRSGDYAHDTAA